MPLKLSRRLLEMQEAAGVALADRVRRMQDSGRTVIALGTGDPDFTTPASIMRTAFDAMQRGETHYANSRGLPVLRQAIADSLRRGGVEYGPASEILVTCGGIHAYACALQAILEPEGEVLVPDPTWMTHFNLVTVCGGNPVRVPARPENGFWPLLEDWERAVSPRTVALVLNSPSNPTGAVATREYLERVNQFAAARNLYVISDEVYDHILYDGRQHTCFAALPGARSRCLLINSFSKTYAMTGWRIGYLAGPAEVVSQALKASQHSITNVAPFVQRAAAFALTDAEVQQEVSRMAAAYARRRDSVLRIWREFGATPVRADAPQGAFYFFLDVRQLGRPSEEIAESLLEEASVATVPGSVYGEGGEGFLRMTSAASDEDVQNGFRGLLKWAAQQSRK